MRACVRPSFARGDAAVRGLKTFYEVGGALLAIRDDPAKLYRQHGTFENYCDKRWGMTDNYARRLVSSAEVVHNLKTVPMGTVLPANERQARPLASLEPTEQQQVWKEVTVAATREVVPEPVTAARVEAAVATFTQQKRGCQRPGKGGSVQGAVRCAAIVGCKCFSPGGEGRAGSHPPPATRYTAPALPGEVPLRVTSAARWGALARSSGRRWQRCPMGARREALRRRAVRDAPFAPEAAPARPSPGSERDQGRPSKKTRKNGHPSIIIV